MTNRKKDPKTGKFVGESMADAVGEERDRPEELPLSPKLERSMHKIDDYSPGAGRYVRQQRLQLTIKKGHKPVVKALLSSFHVIEHRDQYDTIDRDNRKLLVESDETTIIVIATQHDPKNLIGRSMRKGRAEPISSLADTLAKAVGLVGETQDEQPRDRSEDGELQE